MSQLTEQEKNLLFETLEKQNKSLARLEQGMYGDDQLGIKGLISDMHYVKKWIAGHKLKVAYLTGIFTAVGFGVKAAWEYVTRK